MKVTASGLAGGMMAGAEASMGSYGTAGKTGASDPAKLRLSEASELVHARKISPVELTQECLKRIDRLNPKLNAFITVTAESALAQATTTVKAGDFCSPSDQGQTRTAASGEQVACMNGPDGRLRWEPAAQVVATVPDAIRASEAITAGQRTFEHLIGIFEASTPDEDAFLARRWGAGNDPSINKSLATLSGLLFIFADGVVDNLADYRVWTCAALEQGN